MKFPDRISGSGGLTKIIPYRFIRLPDAGVELAGYLSLIKN
ncbi:hypothetical protein HMPREF1981_03376 [Bacteroides pyogenes F0041]|uniref:Uncharacterized protein n=1 Tax=Bacteroides pyogenes F0041 TaxID=1321819 RepID=U2DN93_9BACE|nr:hypothetical protein HMPREF1981_03376 [Bacteroides pyogenes F0041]